MLLWLNVILTTVATAGLICKGRRAAAICGLLATVGATIWATLFYPL